MYYNLPIFHLYVLKLTNILILITTTSVFSINISFVLAQIIHSLIISILDFKTDNQFHSTGMDLVWIPASRIGFNASNMAMFIETMIGIISNYCNYQYWGFSSYSRVKIYEFCNTTHYDMDTAIGQNTFDTEMKFEIPQNAFDIEI